MSSNYVVTPMVPEIGPYNSVTHTVEYQAPTIPECGDTKFVGTDLTLGPGSFVFGLLVGVLILFIIFFMMYTFRVLFFANMPYDFPTCTATDYYATPGQALANTGLHATDILYVQNGTLFYKRVPQTLTCTPGSDQTIPISYPQYCLFARDPALTDQEREEFLSGEITVNEIQQQLGVGRTNGVSTHNTQAAYSVEIWRDMVDAGVNCQPTSGAALGRPLVRWDPSVN